MLEKTLKAIEGMLLDFIYHVLNQNSCACLIIIEETIFSCWINQTEMMHLTPCPILELKMVQVGHISMPKTLTEGKSTDEKYSLFRVLCHPGWPWICYTGLTLILKPPPLNTGVLDMCHHLQFIRHLDGTWGLIHLGQHCNTCATTPAWEALSPHPKEEKTVNEKSNWVQH